ncbi:hypothetical protein BP6252_10181 [Coleophoma cylindrospora]|uniref:AB hydrolase-1 domain-containing protein n=1 Tax=Coleophoma cylindrospora TaxID=1849047 RepID=A0A3D8QXN4_9HELO|nr:hypothetical protein BP6252_10181 [Coleophoma cylindrospora]
MPTYGLDELYSLDDAKFDLVFVHGLTGDRRRSWTKNNVFWPKELLPLDLPLARIITFGYDAAVVDLNNEVSQSTMETHAADICDRLARLRLGTSAVERPIIFVAHSLGGLVCAQTIVNGASGVPTDNAFTIANRTRGIVFLGTPFHGSPTAKYMEVLRRVIDVFHNTNSRKINDLKERSEKLEILVEAFARRLRQRLSEGKELGVFFFSETLPIHGHVIVPESNAKIIGYGDHASIHANHSEICKFASEHEEGYKSVLAAIKKLADKATEIKTKDSITNIWNNNDNTKVGQQVGQQNVSGDLNFA